MANAIIFRKRLLAYTETFIAEQAHHLPNWKPIFTGFSKDREGYSLLEDKLCFERGYFECLESSYSLFPSITAGLHKKLNILNAKWVAQLRSLSPAIVHAHFGADGFCCAPLAKKLGVPLITTFHGNDITQNTPVNYYRKNRHKVFEHSEKIIAVSNFIRNELILKGCPEEKIIQHYIGVDTHKFTPSKQPPQKGKIVFVGRLVEKKGCEYLVEAMQKIHNDYPDICLNIIGDGPKKAALTEQAAKAPCNIVFRGRLAPDEVAEEIQSSLLVCAPSVTAGSGDQEGLPISILESLASGVPVVSTYSAGIAEAVEDGVNGELLSERDVDGIATSIVHICNDTAYQKELSKNARSIALDKFNLDRQCARLEEIYQQASTEHSDKNKH